MRPQDYAADFSAVVQELASCITSNPVSTLLPDSARGKSVSCLGREKGSLPRDHTIDAKVDGENDQKKVS